jgi:two-component system cell cycle response regulator
MVLHDYESDSDPRTLACAFADLSNAGRPAGGLNPRLDDAGHGRHPVRQKLSESKERPYVYVLLLTGRSQKEDLLAGLESGADDYLTKPFDAQELRACLHVGQRILGLQDKLIAAGEQLLFRATHDSLTGVANRGVILDTLRRERSRQSRDGGSFGIASWISTTSNMLRETTQRMMASVRPYDTVGRYGGEEFLIVVPSSDAMGALGLSERIRRASAEQAIAADSVPLRSRRALASLPAPRHAR